MNTVGAESAVGTTVDLPTHQAGDLIIISARRASSSYASPPAAGGSVPAWEKIRETNVIDGANSVSLITYTAIASGNSHTSGTWANASHLIATVLRPDSGAGVVIPEATVTKLASTGSDGSLDYPALTLFSPATITDNVGYRVAVSSDASVRIGDAPSGDWLRMRAVPASDDIGTPDSSTLMAAFADSDFEAGTTRDIVTIDTAAATIAHTLQIAETGSSAPASVFDDLLDFVRLLPNAKFFPLCNIVGVPRDSTYGADGFQYIHDRLTLEWAFARVGTLAAIEGVTNPDDWRVRYATTIANRAPKISRDNPPYGTPYFEGYPPRPMWTPWPARYPEALGWSESDELSGFLTRLFAAVLVCPTDATELRSYAHRCSMRGGFDHDEWDAMYTAALAGEYDHGWRHQSEARGYWQAETPPVPH